MKDSNPILNDLLNIAGVGGYSEQDHDRALGALQADIDATPAHTPGPWDHYGSIRQVGNPDEGATMEYCGSVAQASEKGYRGKICVIQSAVCIRGITPKEAKANAKLIAAAPCMYDKLEALIAVIGESYSVNGAVDTDWDDRLKDAYEDAVQVFSAITR